MMNFEEFLNEALIPQKKYTEDDVKKMLSKYLQKEVDDIPKKAVNYYSNALYMLQKKFNGYHPDDTDHEGPADDYFMDILKKIYHVSTGKKFHR